MPRKPPPCILITACLEERGEEFADTSTSLSDRYPEAVVAAGGLPWLLPCLPQENLIAQAVRRADGVLLTGGEDVDPRLYARRLPRRLAATVKRTTPRRDLAEILLIREVFRQRKPLLAICRGHQLLNVALGGTLFVDLPHQRPGPIRHCRLDARDRPVHKVALTPGSLIHNMAGTDTLSVNSTHHQGVDRVASPLRPTAVSPDGLVEGLELAAGAGRWLPFLLAVQFHPERMLAREPAFVQMFGGLTRAAARQCP